MRMGKSFRANLTLGLIALFSPILTVFAAEPASAATCQWFASYSIEVCGTWNGEVTTASGQTYARTYSFTWTVTRGSQAGLSILSVSVRMGVESRCIGGWSGCQVMQYNNVVSRATTGKVNSVPVWANRWGAIEGTPNFQLSNLTIHWCYGTHCETDTTVNIGEGSPEPPDLGGG